MQPSKKEDKQTIPESSQDLSDCSPLVELQGLPSAKTRLYIAAREVCQQRAVEILPREPAAQVGKRLLCFFADAVNKPLGHKTLLASPLLSHNFKLVRHLMWNMFEVSKWLTSIGSWSRSPRLRLVCQYTCTVGAWAGDICHHTHPGHLWAFRSPQCHWEKQGLQAACEKMSWHPLHDHFCCIVLGSLIL